MNRLYQTALERVPKSGLENMQKILERLDSPEKKCRFVHIAGSNGKGTVAWKIASAIDAKVGLFTSPHISSFRERIRINGEMIPQKRLDDLLFQVYHVLDKYHLQANFFEITTCTGLLYFAQEKVDLAVLETGLGGRFDATNVALPQVAIITSICLEHTDILGGTIEKIAFEKAGIIKPNIPVIIGPSVPREVIRPLTTGPLIFASDNTAIAKEACKCLPFQFSEDKLLVRPPCRFEEVGSVILDVAHNAEACTHVVNKIKQQQPNLPLYCLFGHSKKESLEGCLKALKPYVKRFYMVDKTGSRTLPAKTLQSHAQSLGCPSECCKNIQEALSSALKQKGRLLVCGSFYILSDVRKFLGINDIYD